jgi:glycosyltransferase involved in cell wall biosynthesis
MTDADVALFTSRFGFEGLSLVLLEAMAHARPCVVTRIGGYLEACDDAGIAVEVGDADAVARAVAHLYDDDERRRALGAAARARASRFTWDATAAKLIDAAEEALRRHRQHEHR